MLLATLLMSVFYLSQAQHEGGSYIPGMDNVKPSTEWSQKNQAKFDQLDTASFPVSVAHSLHSLTIEDAKLNFNINLPIDNGIPTVNTNISAPETEKILSYIPSRPTGMASAAMHKFVDIMNHMNDKNWQYVGSTTDKVFHGMHMIDNWAMGKATADSFDNVHDDICLAALDTENNGVLESLELIATFIRNYTLGVYAKKSFLACDTNNTKNQILATHPLTLEDNGESWQLWKPEAGDWNMHCQKEKRSLGLFIHCLGRKFPNKENPVEVCCDSKTVGAYTYTKVSTGAVPGYRRGAVPKNCLNNCIYSRDDKPGSKYCFAIGEEEVHCLKEG